MNLHLSLSIQSSSANHCLHVLVVPLGDHDPPDDDLDPEDLVAADTDRNPAELGAGDSALFAGVTVYAKAVLDEVLFDLCCAGDEERPLCGPWDLVLVCL